MDPEIAAYIESLRSRFAAIEAAIGGVSGPRLNWSPSAGDANSIYALAMHTAGNARAWIIGIACEQPMRRDRPGEFASRGGDPAVLIAAMRAAADDICAALERIDTSRLGVRSVPPQELWGEGSAREISIRDAIVHVIEHASLHLGHIQLTRDLAAANGE